MNVQVTVEALEAAERSIRGMGHTTIAQEWAELTKIIAQCPMVVEAMVATYNHNQQDPRIMTCQLLAFGIQLGTRLQLLTSPEGLTN